MVKGKGKMPRGKKRKVTYNGPDGMVEEIHYEQEFLRLYQITNPGNSGRKIGEVSWVVNSSIDSYIIKHRKKGLRHIRKLLNEAYSHVLTVHSQIEELEKKFNKKIKNSSDYEELLLKSIFGEDFHYGED